MDKIVYNADVVVKASENIIAVKVDGDEHPDLVKQFEVTGYQSVKQTAAFLETTLMIKKN